MLFLLSSMAAASYSMFSGEGFSVVVYILERISLSRVFIRFRLVIILFISCNLR